MQTQTATPCRSLLLSGQVARPFEGEGALTPLAHLDQLLLQGDGPGHFSQEQLKSLADLSVAAPIRQKPAGALLQRVRNYPLPAVVMGTIGYVAAACTPIGPLAFLVGGAAALMGVAIRDRNMRAHWSGPVTVQTDETRRQEHWDGNLTNFSLTPQELRHRLLMDGHLGDSVPSSLDRPVTESPSADKLKPWTSVGSKLAQLDESRRLVADLGLTSSYGHAVASLVSAADAQRLLAAGKPVYVVDGQPPTDTEHVYRTAAAPADKQQAEAHNASCTERDFTYQLRPILQPSDLHHIDEKPEGVPIGLDGVYLHADSIGQAVNRKEQTGTGRVVVDGNGVVASHTNNHTEWTSDGGGVPQSHAGVRLGRFKNWGGVMTTVGLCLGTVASLALGGAPVLALGIIAMTAVAGRGVGDIMDTHDRNNSPVVVDLQG